MLSQVAFVTQDGTEAHVNFCIREQTYLDWPGAPTWLNVVASWRLPQLQNWVYVAVLPIKDQDPYADVEKMARTSGAIVELDSQPTITDKDCFVVRVAGDEFSDCLQSLGNPPNCEAEQDDFPVGNWASIARMGSYFGDIACILAHRYNVIFVATLVRMCSDADLMDKAYCPHVLRMPLIGLRGAVSGGTQDIEEISFGEIECTKEADGPQRMFTKSGLRVMAYHPWELRRERADGSPLSLTEREAQLFRQALPANLTESMPLPEEKVSLFSNSERVRLSDSPGVLTERCFHLTSHSFTLDKELSFREVYVEKSQSICYIPEKRLMKEHTFEHVFHTERLQNVELISVDYLRGEAKIHCQGITSVGAVTRTSN
jgi:hypothetical protein